MRAPHSPRSDASKAESNLYGHTVNPYNCVVSAAGSSGGEGAVIALRGSLGIELDVRCKSQAIPHNEKNVMFWLKLLYSFRHPKPCGKQPASNGLYAFKLTTFRVPTDGWSSTMTGVIPLKIVQTRKKIGIPSIFLILVTDLSYEHPPTTAFFLCTPLHHRSQMALFREQNRPE